MKFELNEDLGNLRLIDEPARSALLKGGASYLGWSGNSQVIPIPVWDYTAVTKKYKSLKKDNPTVNVLIVTIRKDSKYSYETRDHESYDCVELYYQNRDGSQKFFGQNITGQYGQNLSDSKTGVWLPQQGIDKAWFIVGDAESVKLRNQRRNIAWSDNDPLAKKVSSYGMGEDKAVSTFDGNAARMLVNARLEELKELMLAKFARILDREFKGRENGNSIGIHMRAASFAEFELWAYESLIGGRIDRDKLSKLLRAINAKKAEMLR